MAFYIEMNKLSDSDDHVDYSFGRDSNTGIIRLDKISESIVILKECPLDTTGKWSERAAMKLARLWSSGELPDKTQWAS